MNRAWVEKVREEYDRAGKPDSYPEIELIKGPWPVKISGFREYQTIYKVTK